MGSLLQPFQGPLEMQVDTHGNVMARLQGIDQRVGYVKGQVWLVHQGKVVDLAVRLV